MLMIKVVEYKYWTVLQFCVKELYLGSAIRYGAVKQAWVDTPGFILQYLVTGSTTGLFDYLFFYECSTRDVEKY